MYNCARHRRSYVKIGVSGGAVWVMGQWMMGVMSFQKMCGLFGLKHLIVEISVDVTDVGRTTNKGK